MPGGGAGVNTDPRPLRRCQINSLPAKGNEDPLPSVAGWLSGPYTRHFTAKAVPLSWDTPPACGVHPMTSPSGGGFCNRLPRRERSMPGGEQG